MTYIGLRPRSAFTLNTPSVTQSHRDPMISKKKRTVAMINNFVLKTGENALSNS